jgi:hypothetical protein
MTRPRLAPPLKDYAEEILVLASVLRAAEAIQWSPSLTPKPREDTSERASGGHGDPTLAAVVDDRRLAVREAVDETHASLVEQLALLRSLSARTQLTIDEWNGGA